MVKENIPEIVWSKRASDSFKKIHEFICEDSPVNADKVCNDIINIVDKLPENPEKFPADKFRINNDGNFRAFEKHSYRVAYKIAKNQIRILRIRHVKREPKVY